MLTTNVLASYSDYKQFVSWTSVGESSTYAEQDMKYLKQLCVKIILLLFVEQLQYLLSN